MPTAPATTTNDQPEWGLADAGERRGGSDRQQIAGGELQQHRVVGNKERLERSDRQSERDDAENRTHQGNVNSGGGSLPWHVSPDPCGCLVVLCACHRQLPRNLLIPP
jgi:hypothetical protein